MYYVYIAKSKKTGIHYVGYTKNIQERLRYHNSGRTRSLRKHLPLEIIHVEEYPFYEDARRRERLVKRYKSGAAFQKLLNK